MLPNPQPPIATPRPARSALVLALSLSLAACGGGGSGGGGQVDLQTLSGRIDQAGGDGLAGVAVSLGSAVTQTDDTGAFLMPMVGVLPIGPNLVHIDGSSATDPGSFPGLEVLVELEPGMANATLSQVVTLPNLDVPEAANQSVAVDGSGAVIEPIDLFGPDGDLGLAGPIGTVVTLHGDPAAIGVDFNVTPVPPSEVPMPLPEELYGVSFVTVQPGGASFATPAAGGLDATLPNPADLPVGAEVDVWSFDHDVGDWVDRSAETGNRGVVIDLGSGMTAIQAAGVITEGGWHAPVIPIDPECATTLTGLVVDGSGTPLEGVSVFTDLGQFGTTDATGRFTLPLVPNYDVTADVCTPIEITLRAEAPILIGGGASAALVVSAAQAVPGGVAEVGPIVIPVPLTGCVTGVVSGPTADPAQRVVIDGPTPIEAQVFESGTFFRCDLEPGLYTASYLFEDDLEPTVVEFTIQPFAVATVALQKVTGGGADSVTVRVLRDAPEPYGAATPVAGALVLLQGTDPGSVDGLVAAADANGIATFNSVTGPYTVTAVIEEMSMGQYPGDTFRRAASVVGIDPPTGEIGLLMGVNTLDGQADPPIAAALNVTVAGWTSALDIDVEVTNRELAERRPTFRSSLDFPSAASLPLNVPSGQLLDAICTVTDNSSAFELQGFQAIVGVGPFAPGATQSIQFDLGGPDYVPLDQMVPASMTGLPAMLSDVELVLELRDPERNLRNLMYLGYGSGPIPGPYPLPDPEHDALADLDVVLRAIGYTDNLYDYDIQYFSQRLGETTPASIAMNFDPAPLIGLPDYVLEATPQGVYGTAIPATTAALASGDSGFDLLVFATEYTVAEGAVVKGNNGGGGGGGGGGDLAFEWTVFAPAGAALAIPPAPGVFFPADSDYDCSVQSLRASGFAFDFDTLFSGDVAAKLDALEAGYTTLRVSLADFGLEVGEAGGGPGPK